MKNQESKCEICDKTLTYKQKRFCSRRCYLLSSFKKSNKEDRVIGVCETCGANLAVKQKRYCSVKCYNAREKLINKFCVVCNKRLTRKQKKFCSKTCYNSYRNSIHGNCFYCKKQLKRKSKYCDVSCFKKHKLEMKRKNNGVCVVCGSTLNRKQKFCCSIKCYNEYKLVNKNVLKGKPLSQKHKKKLRFSAINRIKKAMKDGAQIQPNYNRKACEWLAKFDIANKTNGIYATNGGEYFVKELGYWLDYINFDTKLIIEWDEEHHYFGGKIKEKDLIRQKEIEVLFPDFSFKRIRESKLN